MVRDIRLLELSLGSPEKRRLECEMACFNKLGKSLVASKDLIQGSVLHEDDLDVKVGSIYAHEHELKVSSSRYPHRWGTMLIKCTNLLERL